MKKEKGIKKKHLNRNLPQIPKIFSECLKANSLSKENLLRMNLIMNKFTNQSNITQFKIKDIKNGKTRVSSI